MMNNRALSTARAHLMLAAVLALGCASATAARAQIKPDPPAAARQQAAPPSRPDTGGSPPNSVEGVTVNAAPRTDLGRIPPDKKAALDAEAAKDKAWRDYRKSTPPLTNDPNDDSKDYPGLQSLLPPQ